MLAGVALAAATASAASIHRYGRDSDRRGNGDGESAMSWKLAGASATGIANGDLDGDGVAGIDPHHFNLTATVVDATRNAPFSLYPGAQATVVVTVWNTTNQNMQVNQLVVTPGDASPGCTAANLAAGSFSGSVPVPANGTATVDVPLSMTTTAPDACKDVSFPLALWGAGGKQ